MEVQKNNLLIENLRIKIEQAIDTARMNGYHLVQGTWCYDNLICPLSALNPSKIRSTKDAVNYLNLSTHWIYSFINGFDDYGPRNCDLDAYELGCYFRLKYNPKPYYELIRI